MCSCGVRSAPVRPGAWAIAICAWYSCPCPKCQHRQTPCKPFIGMEWVEGEETDFISHGCCTACDALHFKDIERYAEGER